MIPVYNIRVWHASTAIAEFGHFDPVTYDVAQPMAAPIDNYELAYSFDWSSILTFIAFKIVFMYITFSSMWLIIWITADQI